MLWMYLWRTPGWCAIAKPPPTLKSPISLISPLPHRSHPLPPVFAVPLASFTVPEPSPEAAPPPASSSLLPQPPPYPLSTVPSPQRRPPSPRTLAPPASGLTTSSASPSRRPSSPTPSSASPSPPAAPLPPPLQRSSSSKQPGKMMMHFHSVFLFSLSICTTCLL